MFTEQVPCHENITGIVISVAVDAPIEVWRSLYHSVPYLLRQSAQHIVCCLLKLNGCFAGLIIDIDVPEHYLMPLMVNFGSLMKSASCSMTLSLVRRIAPISVFTLSSCPMLEK